ncbi:MAG TPA: TonB-dependent receptor [Dyella sp.]|uniref:TonB-dependent receptor plug domain-containing protein n=1 Tax=Dyella sp. TaxID=1869338 RepID=UPI002D78F929|nr:TonB-dependent receptor [Dyella sp.]HET6553878.1 TonB-dependent receptor [Dyella sp.]
MKFGENKLCTSVRLALSLGMLAASAYGTAAFAQDAQTTTPPPPPPDQAKSKTLETVTVTGSLIRRVDVETASPVITIDRSTIEATGKQTLGDLVQQLPAMTGGNVNPQTNNGGGSGQSSINLRGLGSNRTLILVDGHRVLSTDPNAIPASMIERIEVLTDGASATYGSDAIGGVVNFILRKNYEGATFTANVGESDRNDGDQSGYTFTFGHTSDKGSIVGGVEYNKQEGVLAGSRDFSKNSLTRYGTNGLGPSAPQPPTTYIGGSTSSEYGHIQLPAALKGTFGCSFVALTPGGNSQVVDPTNYHCYQNNGANSDKYNYATVNLVMTPQERTNAFIMGTYNLAENVQVYMDAYYNKTSSQFQLAPAIYATPPYAQSTLNISADNYWNQFGTDFRSGANTYNARLTEIGNRQAKFGTDNGQIATGFKGNFTVWDKDWNWDVGFDYGHQSVKTTTLGLPNTNNLYTGPSSMINGQVMCVAPGGAAPADGTNGCNGLDPNFNPFDLHSAGSVAALQKAAVPALSDTYSIERIYHAGINGAVFDLPAGAVQLAVGADYRKEYQRAIVDPLLNIDPATGGCVLGSQCTASLLGGYNVKELFAEAFFPILTGLPGAQSLNLTVGDRYSKFSTFGSTNNFKFGLEWKPFDDLLLRGTMAEVFRAPNITEVYGAPSADAPRISSDPCDGYTGAPANPACVNVPTDGSFRNTVVQQNLQLSTITGGSQYSGFPIKPEQGKSFDLGAVYSPSWAPGLSGTVDVWHVYLNNIITVVGAQSVLNLCSAGQLVYCQFIHRFDSGPNQGQLTSQFTEPTGNLGSTDTGGVDFSLNYKLPKFDFGQFTVGINGTYLKYYDQNTAPGTPANTTYHNAGHLLPYGSAQAAACPDNSGVCLFPRWRANAFVDWQMGGWDLSWRLRYIGRFQMGSKSPSQDVFPDGTCYYGSYCTIHGAEYKYGATTYNDVSIGYNIEPLNTHLDFGVNNVFDKQPPMLYANNTLNANTDPSDFDLMGRYFWARVTVKF